MLQKVVFILDDEKAIDDVGDLANELLQYGAAVRIIVKPYRNFATAKDWGIQELVKTHSGSTLYITDNPLFYEYLRGNSLPIIVYMHEGNRGKNFPCAEYVIEQIEEIEYESLNLAYLRLTGQPWTILETERCIIRETTTADVDSFYTIYGAPSITRYMENLYQDKDEEIAYIKDYIKNVYAFYGYGMWTVLEKSSQSVIGRAGISWREGYDIPELGFVIALPFQRQGYAYEVCQAITKYGQQELGFNSLQALIMEGNKKSIALCRKLGFVHEEKVAIDGIQYDRMILLM